MECLWILQSIQTSQNVSCFTSLSLMFHDHCPCTYYPLLADGPGAGFRTSNLGSGASYGGEAGCESSNILAPDCYGSYIRPSDYGSGGGKGVHNSRTYQGQCCHWLQHKSGHQFSKNALWTYMCIFVGFYASFKIFSTMSFYINWYIHAKRG